MQSLTRITFDIVAGKPYELVLFQTDFKRFNMRVHINGDGSNRVDYIVYNDKDVPLMATPVLKDAIVRYNAITAPSKEPEVVENNSSL